MMSQTRLTARLDEVLARVEHWRCWTAWAGLWSGLINVATSLALIGLIVTGLWIWARRSLRMRARKREKALAGA